MPLPITFGVASARGFGLFSAPVALLDEYFEYVTLLLPGNGTNGAQNNTFLDSSNNNFTITRNGNTTQGTFSPYGSNWSNYFNGSNTTLRNTAINISTGNWTVEAWVFLNAMPTSDSWPGSYISWMNITSVGTASVGDGWQFRIGQTVLAFGTNNDTTAVSATHGMSVGQWYHLAVTRVGNVYTLYKNGTSIGSATYTANAPGTGAFTWTGSETNEGAYLNGYLSNVRIVAGTAVYTANFIPPTAPLTAITNTSLLTCQSNRFIDNSANAFAITVNGNISVQRFSPFSPTAAYSAATIGGSGYFDGTGDDLRITSNAAFAIGTGDFTFEAWINPPSFATTTPVFVVSDTGGLWIGKNNTNFVIRSYGVADQLQYATMPPTNSWTHIVAVRSGTTLSLYYNGARVATTTNSYNFAQAAATIGGDGEPSSPSYYTGYISNLRLIKGTAVYDPTLTTLTVPTTPLTAVTNTQLLTNFTNASIIDNAMMNDLETVGNAQISTSVSKFGGGSMAFDGTGDWLVTRYNPNLELGSGDFTVEAWVYFSTLPSNAAAAIVSYGDSDNTPRWLLYYDSRTGSANGLRFSVINGSGSAIILVEGGGTSGWAANTWYHVAVTRSGSSWKLFRDGTQTGSTLTDSDSIPTASNNGLVVGAEPNGGIPLTGYIDDLRITKGVARYTANFTPPTQAFPTR